MMIPTTATMTKPLLPGLPSGRSRGHSQTSKQARSCVRPNSTHALFLMVWGVIILPYQSRSGPRCPCASTSNPSPQGRLG